ncbi:uncharacterized protein BYT42DRAFT_615834 [Radiomyces spectabilis]|uniref:uncharacterized protein n=1 Tax=Radiomyces spectabilis TaxID=64574 RepID=UPI002220BE62|nr:uncharacterized protein BYT42DRAFT_615834 [Radiomyces spectabilis]KAI8374702.1 hypothetical protein BYT42DRAFT_615834 [Radiomyces spectabilis]
MPAQATAMMNTEAEGVTRLSDSLILYQLRQIRPKFDAASTYDLVRAFGPLTQAHLCYPFTVFTIADYDQINNPAAILFLPILNNEHLAKSLATMADLHAPTIVAANKLVANFIIKNLREVSDLSSLNFH